MEQLFREGKTLQEIGDQFTLTRERVRQILQKRGLSKVDGGATVRRGEQHIDAYFATARFRMKYGISLAKYKTTDAVPLPHARPQLVCRGDLDSRSRAAKTFDRLVREIATDQGGDDQLSAIERSLIEAFVGGRLWIDNFNCRVLCGEQVDVALFAATANCLDRLASRLGLNPLRSKPILERRQRERAILEAVHDLGLIPDEEDVT